MLRANLNKIRVSEKDYHSSTDPHIDPKSSKFVISWFGSLFQRLQLFNDLNLQDCVCKIFLKCYCHRITVSIIPWGEFEDELLLEDTLEGFKCQPWVWVPTSIQNLASARLSLSLSSRTFAKIAAETRSDAIVSLFSPLLDKTIYFSDQNSWIISWIFPWRIPWKIPFRIPSNSLSNALSNALSNFLKNSLSFTWRIPWRIPGEFKEKFL